MAVSQWVHKDIGVLMTINEAHYMSKSHINPKSN